jgi:hypothetical protein
MRCATESRRLTTAWRIPSAATFAGLVLAAFAPAEEVGERWGTADREREFYPVVELPIPDDLVIEAGAFARLPDDRIAVGTRHGDVFFVSGVDAAKPEPRYHLFASGLDEIFGLAWKDGSLYVTQSCELTRLTDSDGDGRADRFDVVSDAWGYGRYHEYAFGSKFDPGGNLFVALGLSSSYRSEELFRGWILKVTPEGRTIPYASGIRSPGGIGYNEHGALFYIESQGPWNCANSLKFVKQGGFMGHPISFNWYPYAPEMGPAPTEPKSGSTMLEEMKRVPELVPYAVIFPYIRMGRSITGFTIDRSGGAFGPFENQLFMGDYTLSLLMRATTEQVNGVWQGACYPFREGLSTGILNVQFTPGGRLLTGGTNRGWPVRGLKPFALERVEWSGRTPFEIHSLHITPKGFRVDFTKPVDPALASRPENYRLAAFTYPYHGAYGGPEIGRRETPVVRALPAADGRSVTLELGELLKGHVQEFDVSALRSAESEEPLHGFAFYTVNEIPAK